MIKFWLLVIIIYPLRTLATPVVPQFRSGSQTTSSTSQSVINETTTIYGYSLGCEKTDRGSMTSIDTVKFDGEI